MKQIVKGFIFVFLFLSFISVGGADEATWSIKERIQNRDAVIKGKVVSLKKFVDIAEGENLWVATIAVEKVMKSHKLIQGDTIRVYFLSGKDNTPHHVNLEEGETADFYLDARPLLNNEDVLFLDVPADVKG